MKNFVSWLGAFLPTLGGMMVAQFPHGHEQWLTYIVVSLGAGFSGNAARGVNKKIDRKQGKP